MQSSHQVYGIVMGQVVSTFRERRGMRQAELAAACGVGQATISRIERGTLVPDAHLTARIAEALGLSRDQLLHHVDVGVERTRQAASGALGADGDPSAPWWAKAVAVAGVAGLAGLAIFAVAAALAGEDEGRRK